MASQDRDQWPRQHQATQPQRTSIDAYGRYTSALTPEQLALSTRLYQPTVEDVADESGMYHDADQRPLFPQTQLQFPNSNITYSSFGDYDYPTSFNTAGRRSTNPFTPPSLCSDGSTLSSASSNFSIQSPAPDQQCRRRSSQQAFLEWEGQEALARANKRMATGMPTTTPFCRASTDLGSAWGRDESPYSPTVIGRGFIPQSPMQFPDPTENDRVHVKARPQVHDAFSNTRFQPSSYPQTTRTPSVRASPRTHCLPQDVRTQVSASPPHAQTLPSTSPSTSKSPTSPASASFETFLESELHRRCIADKTIHSIRSTQARSVAQGKENTRRTEWAKEVLLKFPIESAMCESLNPGSMMRAVAADGVFDMSAGLAR